ncbi:hypothetical protein [Streptosporangium sp. NPDC000509]|uniref:hypothetical protein n=1 Tax=Streptosporangium sp. NPDC000509 TaxID=3366186 RepID=UPI00369DA05C
MTEMLKLVPSTEQAGGPPATMRACDAAAGRAGAGAGARCGAVWSRWDPADGRSLRWW